MFGQQNGVPSGPMMLMRALGVDPQAIMQSVDQARVMAHECVQHFDMRLQQIETQNAKILVALEFLMKERNGVQ